MDIKVFGFPSSAPLKFNWALLLPSPLVFILVEIILCEFLSCCNMFKCVNAFWSASNLYFVLLYSCCFIFGAFDRHCPYVLEAIVALAELGVAAKDIISLIPQVCPVKFFHSEAVFVLCCL